MKDYKKIAFHVQTFAKRFLNNDYKLKIAIRNNELK